MKSGNAQMFTFLSLLDIFDISLSLLILLTTLLGSSSLLHNRDIALKTIKVEINQHQQQWILYSTKRYHVKLTIPLFSNSF